MSRGVARRSSRSPSPCAGVPVPHVRGRGVRHSHRLDGADLDGAPQGRRSAPSAAIRYPASASEEADREGTSVDGPDGDLDTQSQVVSCTCPICRFTMSVDPRRSGEVEQAPTPATPAIASGSARFPTSSSEPERWDVIVFRFPQEARDHTTSSGWSGCPARRCRSMHGDIVRAAAMPQRADFNIVRKPPESSWPWSRSCTTTTT